MQLIIITGLSGAGKGVALRALEDLGFEAIDNIPLGFLPAIVQSAEAAQNLAVAVDIRNRDFSVPKVDETMRALRADGKLQCQLVFLDCDDDVLQRRFTETRRRHPLADDRTVLDGIRHERALLANLRGMADLVIDTSQLQAADLKRLLGGQFSSGNKMSLTITSFSYKHGIPREADLVFDARFLRNPHYVPELKALTGQDARVGKYIEDDPDFASFYRHLVALLVPLLPRYQAEGKHYLTIAIGCTGGQHRSVYIAERLAHDFSQAGEVSLRHRELS